jgi:hypothetical protein
MELPPAVLFFRRPQPSSTRAAHTPAVMPFGLRLPGHRHIPFFGLATAGLERAHPAPTTSVTQNDIRH